MHGTLIPLLWLGVWYLAVAALIGFLFLFFRLLNQPKWRDSGGDVSHQVGYMKDPVGKAIEEPNKIEKVKEEEADLEHVKPKE